MPSINAASIKVLRERTGAGLLNCKQALEESNGDIDKAVEYLRELGLSSAAKKAGRIAAEGLVNAFVDSKKKVGALIEVNCETDFVAKNAKFKEFVCEMAKLVADINPGSKEILSTVPISDKQTVGEILQGLINRFGENISIRRFERFEVNGTGMVQSYVHDDYLTEGKVGVIIELSVNHEKTLLHDEFVSLAKSLVMHIVALRPEFLQRDDIPEGIVEREKSIIRKKALNDGKSETFIERIIQGGIEKFYQSSCLLEQIYVKANDKTIHQLLQEINSKFDNENISIVRFSCYEKGEGVEKSKNFVSEVKAMTGEEFDLA